MTPNPTLPSIVLVGRVNVGKSTLFNRLAGGRSALVAPVPGLTRDRRSKPVQKHGYAFNLVDTGGLQFSAEDPFDDHVRTQVERAIAEGDLIWLVMDGHDGLTHLDEELYRWMVKQNKPFQLIINKADNPRSPALYEFQALGTDQLYPVSATHNSGFDAALEAAARIFPAIRQVEEEVDPDAEVVPAEFPIRIAFFGKPNVGKSSLVNHILGDERMIVSDVAGTTREAVEIPLEMNGVKYEIVDTAGIRRRSKTHEYAEKIGVLSSLGALRRIHVAVLVLNGDEDISEQDQRLAGYLQDHKRAIVIALNKCDLIKKKQGSLKGMEERVKEMVGFIPYAKVVKTSALTGMGIRELFTAIDEAYGAFNTKVKTADLNRVIELLKLHHPPPSQGKLKTNLLYGVQVKTRPPTFSIMTNRPQSIRVDYTRFVENQLRYHFQFTGTPVVVQWQEKKGGEVRKAAFKGKAVSRRRKGSD